MSTFCLKESQEYYLALSEQPKQFDADSPATNVFFDDTNGEVFTVRSGGVTGVTVSGMDTAVSASFRMEDQGPITSIKFSPDHKILAIQRNRDNQGATVEFANFKDLTPTNVEYSHVCKWKNSKILGFVWPKDNEIAFITDHGIELLQVLPDKKQLKSLKNTSFSGAWFVWCAQSRIVLLAGNNGALLQPFSLNGSSITKLQKLELEGTRPMVERDVFLLKICNTTWCAIFKHGHTPTEVWLMSVSGAAKTQYTHVLKTGLVGRFAISIVDDMIAVHHQSSQTSQLFDIMEERKPENNTVIHLPIVNGTSMKPAMVGDQPCPMYSATWVVFQPNFIIDARLGYLWQVSLIPSGLAHSVPREEISKIVAVLLRRTDSKQTVYSILNQLVSDAGTYLVELGQVFDEINSVYRKWADLEMARNTAGQPAAQGAAGADNPPVLLLDQDDVCSHVLHDRDHELHMVQVMTSYLSSLSRHGLVVQGGVAARCVRVLVGARATGRLHALLRRGCIADSRPLACQLLSLGHLDPAAAQLACDMLWRLHAYEQIVEVLLSWDEPVSAAGAARQAGVWASLPARKLLHAARQCPQTAHAQYVALYHALQARNEAARGTTHFVKSEQCDSYVEYYKQIMSDELTSSESTT